MMTQNKTIFYQAQEAVAKSLNDDVNLSAVHFVAENQKDIEFQIKEALGKQGIVGVVMTPRAEYQGITAAGEQVWNLMDFTVQVVENPLINRTLSSSMTAFDAASRASDILAAPGYGLFGEYCPTTIEQGEDSGLLVAQFKFNCQIRGTTEPVPQKYNVMYKVEGGVASLPEGKYLPNTIIDFISTNGYGVRYFAVNGNQIGTSDQLSVSYPTQAEDQFIEVRFAQQKYNVSWSIHGYCHLDPVVDPGPMVPGTTVNFVVDEQMPAGYLIRKVIVNGETYAVNTRQYTFTFEGAEDVYLDVYADYEKVTLDYNMVGEGATASLPPGTYNKGTSVTFSDSQLPIYSFSVNGVDIQDYVGLSSATIELSSNTFVDVEFKKPQAYVTWNIQNGTADKQQGWIDVGDSIAFTRSSTADYFGLSSCYVNNVEQPMTLGDDSFTYTVDNESEKYIDVSFGQLAHLKFTGEANGEQTVSCSIESQNWLFHPGKEFQIGALSADSWLSTSVPMLSTLTINGQSQLSIAQSFGRPSLSTDHLTLTLQPGENDISATASLLPYWRKDNSPIPGLKWRDGIVLAYADSNNVLNWRCVNPLTSNEFADTSPYSINSARTFYVTGPNVLSSDLTTTTAGYYPVRMHEYESTAGELLDVNDIEEVFVPRCTAEMFTIASTSYLYNRTLVVGAFCYMKKLRKIIFDWMRPSDSHWSECGAKGGGPGSSGDAICFGSFNGSNDPQLNADLKYFLGSKKLEEIEMGYDYGNGVINFQLVGSQSNTGLFSGTNLKEFKFRFRNNLYPSTSGSTASMFSTMFQTNSIKIDFDYVKEEDGFNVDSRLPTTISETVCFTPTAVIAQTMAPIIELSYPKLSNGQAASITTAKNYQVNRYYVYLRRLIFKKVTPKILMGSSNQWTATCQFLKEIVILEADEVPAITPANWAARADKSPFASYAYLPSPIAVYVPDALYDSIIADSNWSQLPARGYYIKKLSTWQNIPALELDNVTITP